MAKSRAVVELVKAQPMKGWAKRYAVVVGGRTRQVLEVHQGHGAVESWAHKNGYTFVGTYEITTREARELDGTLKRRAAERWSPRGEFPSKTYHVKRRKRTSRYSLGMV